MLSIEILLLGSLVTTVLYEFWQYWRNPLNAIPGPFYAKFTRTLLKWQILKGRREMYIHRLHEKYGRFVRIAPNEVSVSDLDSAQMIYSYRAPFAKTDWYKKLVGMDTTVFSMSDVKAHSQRRRILAGPMTESSLKKMSDKVHNKCGLAVDGIEREIREQGHTNVMKWFHFMATDTVAQLSFGESYHMLEHGEDNEFTQDLQKYARVRAWRVETGRLMSILQRLPIRSMQHLFSVEARVIQYGRMRVENYKVAQTKDIEFPTQTLFRDIMKKHVTDEDFLPTNDVVNEARGYISAGSETTAFTLTYLTWVLAHHKEIREKLVAEVAALPSDFTADQLKSLPFLNKVIQETLRLYGAAQASLPRVSPPGGCKFGSYTIPPNTTVSVQAWTMHRDPVYFHDPLKFDPERWTSPTDAMKRAYRPFGAGPTACIGMHLAEMEMRTVTALLYRRFPNLAVSSDDGMQDEDMELFTHFVLKPKRGRCLMSEGTKELI